MKNIIYLSIIISILFFACKKDTTPEKGTGDVNIISLTATDTVVNAWQETSITVVAEGDGIVYSWEANHGEIHGSGKQIKYMAGTCCSGTNTITCTVSNNTNNDSKNIDIRVLPY